MNAAIAIQKQIFEHNKTISDASKRLYFRMGINLGDVMVDGDNLLGDGVNVAARLEGIAPPGGICISEIVHTTVKGKLDCGIIEKGQQKLKNIADPVKAYYLDIKTGEVDPKKFKTPTEKNKTTLFTGGLIAASIAALLFIVNPFKDASLNLNNIVVLPINTTSMDDDQKSLAAWSNARYFNWIKSIFKKTKYYKIKYYLRRFRKNCKKVFCKIPYIWRFKVLS